MEIGILIWIVCGIAAAVIALTVAEMAAFGSDSEYYLGRSVWRSLSWPEVRENVQLVKKTFMKQQQDARTARPI
jgi:hypothetical protein